MATEVISIVDPDNGPGTDYTSLAAWEAGEQGDLTGARDEIAVAECRSSSGSADTTAITIDGWTTSATQYVVVRAAAGHEAVKTGVDTSRYRLSCSGHSSVFADHVRVENIQAIVVGDYTAFQVYNQDAGSDIRFAGCRITGQSPSTGQQRGIYIGSANASVSVVNTIIENMAASGAGRGIQVNASNSVDIFNSVICGCATAGVVEYSAPDPNITLKNCAVFNNGTDFFGTITVDYCASDANTGTNNVAESSGDTHWTSDFADAANGDFTVLADSNLVGAGEVDPGAGLYDADIDGDDRGVAWDLGVDQYVGGGAAGTVTISGGGGVVPNAATARSAVLVVGGGGQVGLSGRKQAGVDLLLSGGGQVAGIVGLKQAGVDLTVSGGGDISLAGSAHQGGLGAVQVSAGGDIAVAAAKGGSTGLVLSGGGSLGADYRTGREGEIQIGGAGSTVLQGAAQRLGNVWVAGGGGVSSTGTSAALADVADQVGVSGVFDILTVLAGSAEATVRLSGDI